jgi:hypothetical protein
MPPTYGDIETCSRRNLKDCGAYVYATDPSTDVHCLCYAVGDSAIQVWMRGDPVPEPYAHPADYGPFVWDGWPFDLNTSWSSATASRRSRSSNRSAHNA